MTSNVLTIQNVEIARLFLIRETVKKLYKVNIIESDSITSNKNNINNVINESRRSKYDTGYTPSRASHSEDGQRQHCQQLSAFRTPTSHTQSDTLSVSLIFEGDVSEQEVDKAKNFARIHLLPGPDYTKSPHQLENQQEFNMVLESLQDIQTTTTALLTFDPECLEVTLQGPSNTVGLARSKVVMILDKLRAQARTDSNNSSDVDFPIAGHTFYKNFLLDNCVEKQNNNDSAKLSHLLINGPRPTESTKQKWCKPRENCTSQIDVSTHKDVLQNTIQPNCHLIKSDSLEDLEYNTVQSPVPCVVVKSEFSPVQSAQTQPLKKTVSPSSHKESTNEENILTDPRYSKKIEHALKLGYSEKQVMKVLIKHGPDCAQNDLLSELIQLGASDADSTVSQSLSSGSDVIFSNDIADFGLVGSQRLSVLRLESGDSSGFSSSADSHGSSLADIADISNLRDVIIDGSNVAMSHGKKVFSCRGIQIAVNWFKERGHKNITAFIPQWRKETSRPDAPITDQEILSDLEKEGIVVFTPARRVKGRRVVCYDDRYVLKLAVETDGIVVSNDVYRDLVNEREDFRKVVDQRLLMYTFANDRFMPPEDPLGRLGPTLDNFLRKIPVEPNPKPQDCPYDKKCTYGNKCRFYHPERGFAPQKLITETLKEQADLKLQERATRLSEIAEKGKRAKQKLFRTKSLVPWEPSMATQIVGGGTKNMTEKPKLSHSKSLVFPSKSCDYLNEPRKRLEEAELTIAMEKLSAQDASFVQQFPAQAVLPDSDMSKTKSSSERSSPVSLKDAMKQGTTSGDALPKNIFSSPKPVSSSFSRASPSHLTVPKVETPERYLSGHLYLAKKLSDESVESNFFSEHTSSPSSTRTSSPVVPLNKIPEQPQFPQADIHSKNRQIDIAGPFTVPPPFHTPLLHQQQVTYSPQTGHYDQDNIPHLSIFEQGMPSHYSHSGTYKQENVEGTHFVDYTHQKISPHTQDNVPDTATDVTLNPYQPLSPYPLFRAEQFPERLNLRRAFSTIGNFKTSEDLHEKLGRRASGFTYGENHLGMKPQSVSALEKSRSYQFGQSYNLNRQNSSSDPQMHAVGAGEPHDVMSPGLTPGDSPRNIQDLYSFSGQHCQTRQHQHRHFENQQLHHLQQDLSSQLPQPRIGIWGEAGVQSNLGHRASIGGDVQSHYSPLENPTFPHNTSHMPHFAPTTTTPNMMPANTFNHNIAYHHQHHQPPIMYATQHDPSSTSMFALSRRQSCPSNYQQIQNFVPSNPFFGYTNIQQTTPKTQPSSIPFIQSEDAPIVPDDPRYTIYYHLSNVFSEQMVRRVMNRCPNERNPNSLCKLILQYKEETGL